jgi:ABC-2 type transport system ATP-binding protein
VVVLGHGKVLADDTVNAVRGIVGVRRVSFALDGELPALPGVVAVDRSEGRVHLLTPDSDRLVRGLVASDVDFRELEVAATSLEEAFLAITAGPAALATAA